MANIASLNIGLSANSAKLTKDLDKARARTKKFGKGAKKDFNGIGKSIKGVAGLLGGLAVGAAFKQSITDVREFGKAAGELGTLGFDDKQLVSFTKSSRELAKTFGTDAAAQVQSYYQAVSAGAANFKEAQAIIEASNKLALGGVTDVATATDGLTTVLNSYGLETKDIGRISDTFFNTMKAGKTTVEEVARSIGKVAPLASKLGISFEETGAAIAQITKGGLSTSESVNGLKAALSNIIKPSKDAMLLADELGIAFNAQALEAEGLIPFIEKVSKATGGSVDQMSKLFGSIEGVNVVLAVATNEGKDFAETLDGIENGAGATDDAVGKMKKTLDFRLNTVNAQFKDLSITFGKSFVPILEKMVPIILDVVGGLADFIEKEPDLAVLATTLGLVGIGIGLVGGPITAAVIAIGAIAYAFENWEEIVKSIKKSFEEFVKFIKGKFTSAVESAGNAIDSVTGFFGFGDGKKDGGLIKAAGGGFIRGPGDGTSDSIPALLSNGEFVINAKSAKKYGSLLESLNNNRFQAGGLVGGAGVSSFFSGGGGFNVSGAAEWAKSLDLSAQALTSITNRINTIYRESLAGTDMQSDAIQRQITAINRLSISSDKTVTSLGKLGTLFEKQFGEGTFNNFREDVRANLSNAFQSGDFKGAIKNIFSNVARLFADRAASQFDSILFGDSKGSGGFLSSLFGLGTGGYVGKGGKIHTFAGGGVVPGSGFKDTVPALLTPGEVVLNKAQQGGGGDTYNFTIEATDAQSFRNMIAQDPKFLSRVADQGKRATTGLRSNR